MGNFLPCLAHGAGNVPTPSNLTKQKLHCYTAILNRLYNFKQSKDSKLSINTKNKDQESIVSLSRDEERKVSQDQKTGTIRVKVVLTKKEAAKLLSLSLKRDKTLGQIMSELKKMESDGLKNENLVGRRNGVWRPELESIPEDLVPVA
ncbi:hypothetical protein LUZ60_010098 [Juncus effusus]|nr:hypothetical protein LUZ60_010098 [Juncus effusus]